MSLSNRVERLEHEQVAAGDGVRFRVIVPPKMSHEEWQARAREMQLERGLALTFDLGREGAADE